MKNRFHRLEFTLIGIAISLWVACVYSQGVPAGSPAALASDPAIKQIGDALSLLRLGTIEEAKQCVAMLEVAQNQNPGRAEFTEARNLIMSIFRTEAGIAASRSAVAKANTQAQQLERNAKMASEVSPLTGKSNSAQADGYREQADLLTSTADDSLRQNQELLVSTLVEARSAFSTRYPGTPMDFMERIAARNNVELPAFVKIEGTVAGEIQEIGGIEMVWCPPGEFLMGSPEDEEGRSDIESQHVERLTRGFWLAKTECTQLQWQRVMNSNPSRSKGATLPVEMVSWYGVQEWLREMNELHPLPDGLIWRLPSEAQWEYACRAGTEGAYSGTGKIDEMGWTYPFSEDKSYAVGTKAPNAWGLLDMHGNGGEWCQDYFGPYPREAEVDPTGPATQPIQVRVLRGGSHSPGDDSRTSKRSGMMAEQKTPIWGFRPAVGLK